MPVLNPIKKTDGDEYVAAFQEWFNKTYGQPMIAVDGKFSVGTKEAYANHGNDFIKVIDKGFQKDKTELTNSLTSLRQELDSMKINAVSKKKFMVFVASGLAIGTIIGFMIGKK